MVLGEHWFERVAGDDGNARLSPLSALQAVGAHIDVSDTAHVQLLLDCTDSHGAGRVASLLSELRSSLHALPLDPALSGLAERVAAAAGETRNGQEDEAAHASMAMHDVHQPPV